MPSGINDSAAPVIAVPISAPLASGGPFMSIGPNWAPSMSPQASKISGEMPMSSHIDPAASPKASKQASISPPPSAASLKAALPAAIASAKPCGLAATASVNSEGNWAPPPAASPPVPVSVSAIFCLHFLERLNFVFKNYLISTKSVEVFLPAESGLKLPQ